MVRCETRSCEEFFDSVSQSLFAIGLRLEDCLRAGAEATNQLTSIDESIQSLHNVIQSIREHGEAHSAARREHEDKS